MLVAMVAACSSEPDCALVVEHIAEIRGGAPAAWSDADRAIAACRDGGMLPAVKRCVVAVHDRRDLHECLAQQPRPPAPLDPAKIQLAQRKDRIAGGDRELRRLAMQAVGAWRRDGRFPAAGPTPALDACCREPSGTCPLDPAAWATPAWTALDFRPERATRFSFQVVPSSDGQKATARAIGDVDCDGTRETLDVVISFTAGEPIISATHLP
jgi:hypothetical protein